MQRLTSPNNEKIKIISKLAKSPKERKYSGLFIVEGSRMAREIPLKYLDELYMTQEFFDNKVDDDENLIRLVNNANDRDKCFITTDPIMRKLSDTEHPQGILATVKMREKTLDDLLGNGGVQPLILILERIQDPGNMGTIIRSAEGAGATGILASYDCVDIYSPKVIRSTMGSIFRMNVVSSFDLSRDIDSLKKKGVKVYGMHLSGESMYEADLTGPVALLIGNEGSGLSQSISQTADRLVRIPMHGKLESLNAASSATIISYEALRQREISMKIDITDMF